MAARIAYEPEAFSLDKSGKETRRLVDEAHLAFIRKLPSAVSGKTPCEACHVRTASAIHRKKKTGLAQKPDDSWTLPLTAEEHKAQHCENELAFWRAHGIDPFELACQLYEVTGARDQALLILKNARPSGSQEPRNEP